MGGGGGCHGSGRGSRVVVGWVVLVTVGGGVWLGVVGMVVVGVGLVVVVGVVRMEMI